MTDLPIAKPLLHTYPKVLRDGYAAALGEHELSGKHKQFMNLAEIGLAHVGSIAFSDYRTRRWNDPDPKVESSLARMRRPAFGHYLELLRSCVKATRPALLDFKPDESAVDLVHCGRLAVAVDGLAEAVELEAHNIARVVARRLESGERHLDWISAWEMLVAYRNRSEGHAVSHEWPTGHPDYYMLMTPLLQSAVTELLTTPHFQRVLDQHPLAVLHEIGYDGEYYQHVFDIDDSGVPVRTQLKLDRSLTELYASPAWAAEINGTFMLTRMPSGAFEFFSIFHDILKNGVPAAIPPKSSDVRTAVRAAVTKPLLPEPPADTTEVAPDEGAETIRVERMPMGTQRVDGPWCALATGSGLVLLSAHDAAVDLRLVDAPGSSEANRIRRRRDLGGRVTGLEATVGTPGVAASFERDGHTWLAGAVADRRGALSWLDVVVPVEAQARILSAEVRGARWTVVLAVGDVVRTLSFDRLGGDRRTHDHEGRVDAMATTDVGPLRLIDAELDGGGLGIDDVDGRWTDVDAHVGSTGCWIVLSAEAGSGTEVRTVRRDGTKSWSAAFWTPGRLDRVRLARPVTGAVAPLVAGSGEGLVRWWRWPDEGPQ